MKVQIRIEYEDNIIDEKENVTAIEETLMYCMGKYIEICETVSPRKVVKYSEWRDTYD